MDLVLHVADEWFFTPYIYSDTWKPDDIYRQAISLFIIVTVSADVIYLGLASLNYFLLYDPKLKEHPHFQKVYYLRDYNSIAIHDIQYLSFFRIKCVWK